MTTENTTRNDSLAARTDTWLQSLLVWSPGQRDIIKTVALVLMVLDHANRILHLDQTWMFLAGRGAFPLFALVWGLNLSRHAHIRQPAINRLWGWAVIAQFAYYLAGFPWYEGNILFAFAVAAQVLTWCETRSLWRSVGAMLLLAVWLPLSGTSYSIAGLLMLAPVRMFALKFHGFGWRGNELRYSFLLLSAVLIGVLRLYAIPAIVGAYVLVSTVRWLRRRPRNEAR